MEIVTRYAVEGLYVDRISSIFCESPDEWVRGWKTWMECSSEERVQAVLANGFKLITKNDYSGFSALRVVKITEHKEIIFQ